MLIGDRAHYDLAEAIQLDLEGKVLKMGTLTDFLPIHDFNVAP
ncbi:MAG: hypothetical protein AAF514_18520 [Verrucomicrobiota bacterium]